MEESGGEELKEKKKGRVGEVGEDGVHTSVHRTLHTGLRI